MHNFLNFLCKAFLLCCIINIQGVKGQVQTKKQKKVNILFLMSDQHRGDCIGAEGADWVQTPNLDKLASEGVLYTNAYASVPSCLASRAGILTGMSPWQSGQLGYKPIVDYSYEMAQMFTDSGYRTHAVGKNHFTPMRHKHGYQTVELEEAWYTSRVGLHAILEKNRNIPLNDSLKCDYTRWFEKQMPGVSLNASGLGYTDHNGDVFPFEDKYHPTHWTAQRAVEFLETYDGEAPFLLKVSFQRPHPPFDPPARWMEHYKDTNIPKARVSSWSEQKNGNKTGLLKELRNPTTANVPLEEIESSRRAYYATISHVDEQLGRVIEALRKRGEIENTLIVYTSDHGDMMGDHYYWRKCRPYEGSARVPMILYWPESLRLNAKRGQVREDLVELRDLLPTFLDAAGLLQPEVMDGVSMLNTLKAKPWRDILDLEHAQLYEPDNAWVALTDERYKYIYFTLTGQQQLFDLQNDPHELFDLASKGVFKKNKALIEEWRAKMIKHLEIRGEQWVKNGELVIQKKSIYYGENHPVFGKNTQK